MESLHIKTYLLYAIYILRTHPFILYLVAAVGIFNGITVFLPQGGLSNMITGVTLIATIFLNPLIYGLYYEIVEEKSSPLSSVFKTYVPGYLLLLFCLYVPIIFTTALISSSTGNETNSGYIMLTIVFFSLLFLYVIPTYYISGAILDSIAIGVRFFIKNIFHSAPLMVLALASELLLLLSHFKLGWLRENNPVTFVVVDFTVYMAATLLDFLLFIILIYILRNQNIKKREPR